MTKHIQLDTPESRQQSTLQQEKFADELKPEYARILRNVPVSDEHKIKIVNQLRAVIGQVVQAYLEEKLGLTERDY